MGEYITGWPDYIGLALFIIGAVLIIAVAFEKSTGWGVAMLLFGGLLWPVFVLFNWNKTSFWFFFALTGFLVCYIF
jgi:hypothetical protein